MRFINYKLINEHGLGYLIEGKYAIELRERYLDCIDIFFSHNPLTKDNKQEFDMILGLLEEANNFFENYDKSVPYIFERVLGDLEFAIDTVKLKAPIWQEDIDQADEYFEYIKENMRILILCIETQYEINWKWLENNCKEIKRECCRNN